MKRPSPRPLSRACVVLLGCMFLTACTSSDLYPLHFGAARDYSFGATAFHGNQDGKVEGAHSFENGGRESFTADENIIMGFYPVYEIAENRHVEAWLFTPRTGAGQDTVDRRRGERVLSQYGDGGHPVLWVEAPATAFLARGGPGTYSIWWTIDGDVKSRYDFEIQR